MKFTIFENLKGFSSLMSDSKSFWDNTFKEFGENICGCECTEVLNPENNNEKESQENKEAIMEIDKLFIDKRDNKNEIKNNKSEKDENNSKHLNLYFSNFILLLLNLFYKYKTFICQ
jgi:hypothetical protein